MQQIPAELENDHDLVEAFHILERGGWTDNDYQVYLAEVDLWRKEQSRQDAALEALERGLEQGLAKGLAQGLEQGMEKGLVEGREEGEKKAKLEMARALLAEGLSIEKVAALTKLSVDEPALRPDLRSNVGVGGSYEIEERERRRDQDSAKKIKN